MSRLSLDELLSTDDEVPSKRLSLDELLAVDAPPATRSSSKAPTDAEITALNEWNQQDQSLPWWKSAVRGAYDPLLALGQNMQHVVPDKVLNAARKVSDPIVNFALGGEPVDSSNTSSEDFDAMIRRREQTHQAERTAAGKEGLDWWRVGGNLANPTTWLNPAGKGAGVWEAIKAGAKTGAFQSLLQPVATEGNFLYDKGMQMLVGTGIGGTLGGSLTALSPVFSKGAEYVRSALGKGEGASAQAQRLTDDVLKAVDAEPKKLDPNLYSAIQREVTDALKLGVDPDPKVMERYADAAALPVPVQLTRAEATRDPLAYAWEHRVTGQRGAGEAMAQRKAANNRALIENLNELGARNAPSPYDASQQLISHIQGVDDALRAQVNQAYKAVRDSAGLPARVSNDDFAQLSKNALTDGRPEMASLTSLADYLPDTIARQYNDILSGKLPLTVDTVQFLDRNWGGVQRGAADDTIKKAIGALRSALNDAPVSDALGAESMAAYKAARGLAKQRFSMIEANPAYKAVVDGVEPDKFFQKYVQGANVSELGALKNLIGPDNVQVLQRTLIGNLKRKALSNASDENGVFSQSAFNNVLQDPVQAPRLAELFKDAPQTLGHLYRVGRAAENIQKPPAASRVNYSNTGSEISNIVRDVFNSEASASLWNLMPGARTIREVQAQHQARKAVNTALKPGVTSSSALPTSSSGVRRLSDLAARAGTRASVAGGERE